MLQGRIITAATYKIKNLTGSKVHGQMLLHNDEKPYAFEIIDHKIANLGYDVLPCPLYLVNVFPTVLKQWKYN